MRAIGVVDPYLRRYQSFQTSRLLRWAMSHPVGLLGSAERVAYSAAVDWKMVISGKLETTSRPSSSCAVMLGSCGFGLARKLTSKNGSFAR